jgi:hypothetical protein
VKSISIRETEEKEKRERKRKEIPCSVAIKFQSL